MANEGLIASGSVTPAQIAVALIEIASSPYNETRARLAEGLVSLWKLDCSEKPFAHEAAVAAASRLIETAGYGPLSRSGYGYTHATLPRPVNDFLASSNDFVLDLSAASFGIPVLAAGTTQQCRHGAEAKELLNVLVSYDERIWPSRYAGRNYSGTSFWRNRIDQVVAQQILSGDVESLDRRLDLFTGVEEELVGLLQSLSREANDAGTAGRLHAVWPRILDRLLPEARDLHVASSRRERPRYRDLQALDRALLLIPEQGVDYWPWQETITLAAPWLRAVAGRASMADQAITFSLRVLGIRSEVGAHIVLQTLGDDVESIQRDSALAVTFLRVILRDPPSDAVASQARALLDGLAVIGDETALEVQRELENG